MSRTITLEKYESETQLESPAETQALLWSEVMEALGYPASWENEIRAQLAVEGKDIEWTKVNGSENQ